MHTASADRKRITTDSLWNMAGVLVPALVAIGLTPTILAHLGPSRFGLLSQMWLLCGYAGMFDFGFGMILTRSVAAYYGQGQEDRLLVARRLVRLAKFLVGGFGLAVAAAWFAAGRLLPAWAQDPEVHGAVSWLFALVPVASLTAVYRGILVGKGAFAKANIVRIILGAATFTAPLIVFAASRLTGGATVAKVLVVFLVLRIGLLLVVIRWARLPAMASSSASEPLAPRLFRRELRGSAVMLAMSLLMPLLASVDRAVLSATATLAAIGGYNIVMDTMMKLLIWPNAVSGVALQRFSHHRGDDASDVSLFVELQTQVGALVVPAALIVLVAGSQVLTWWLKTPPGYVDPRVIKLLALGALSLAFAQVPCGLFFARKAEQIPFIVNLAELPIYFLILRAVGRSHGMVGVAAVAAARMMFDNVLFHTFIIFRGIRWYRSPRYLTSMIVVLAAVTVALVAR